ncbi:MAG TPA: outer membrane beta-barrel protein [Candidatus Acidoferrum sp.]|nr:outer membrane beta-barrel protein [Candidatus Acidoferrum sp.]
MSSQSKSHPGRVLTMLAVMIAAVCTIATLAAAQEGPAPKWELYGGYSFFYPGADVHGQLPGALLPVSSALESDPRGAGASVTYNFNRWFGLTLDGSTHWGSGESGISNRIDDTGFTNFSIGPKVTFRSHHFSPFLEVLVGDQRIMPEAFHDVSKLGLMFGGGLDINLSRHVALRLIRADYVASNYQYGDPSVTPKTDIRGLRAQVGLNFMFGGGEPPLPPSAACSLQPMEVFAGETVTVTASGANFNPKRTVKYDWTGTGVKVAGSDASAQIDTTGLQPGSYVVTANLSDGRKNGTASCSARFTVKEPRPPVISCLADPASVQMGGTSTIKSNASSPDGRRVSYSYTTSAGEISGNGDTAALHTRGAQPGRITVTCNVSDDRNPALTGSSNTMVNVEAPPPPPAPAPEIKQLEAKLALHSIYFATARPTAENPERGLVDSQAEILKALAEDFTNYLKYKPDAHLILSGHADPRGSVEYNKGLTDRRVGRAKDFLVEHGVPADHFELKSFGKEDELTADQIKEQMAQDPDLTPDDRQQMLKNLRVMVLANNRRVDITLSTTGQQSMRRYPFNAKDFLALSNTKGGEKRSAVKKKP